jgi:hypothetical protein
MCDKNFLHGRRRFNPIKREKTVRVRVAIVWAIFLRMPVILGVARFLVNEPDVVHCCRRQKKAPHEAGLSNQLFLRGI